MITLEKNCLTLGLGNECQLLLSTQTFFHSFVGDSWHGTSSCITVTVSQTDFYQYLKACCLLPVATLTLKSAQVVKFVLLLDAVWMVNKRDQYFKKIDCFRNLHKKTIFSSVKNLGKTT